MILLPRTAVSSLGVEPQARIKLQAMLASIEKKRKKTSIRYRGLRGEGGEFWLEVEG